MGGYVTRRDDAHPRAPRRDRLERATPLAGPLGHGAERGRPRAGAPARGRARSRSTPSTRATSRARGTRPRSSPSARPRASARPAPARARLRLVGGTDHEEIESSFPEEQARWRAGIGAGATTPSRSRRSRPGSGASSTTSRRGTPARRSRRDPRGPIRVVQPSRPGSITSATTGRSRPWPTAPRPVLPFGTENSRR